MYFRWFICVFAAFFVLFPVRNAVFHGNHRQIKKACRAILVDPSGRGNTTTIQAAINKVPEYNERWVCILIREGLYREQVLIPYNKPYIYLTGAGKRKTSIVWNAHESTDTSATFNCAADNIIAKGITFINCYNYPLKGSSKPLAVAVAARIGGDKSAFFRCGFVGLQDTLWDVEGRHYFEKCTIQGAVDFIFGSGQSIYQQCTIAVVAGVLDGPGYITAQGRASLSETNGFVFKDCTITGNGKTYLGRPWRPYARVIFYNTLMNGVVVPQGWSPWFTGSDMSTVTFEEFSCRGPGSDTKGRVNWANRHSMSQLQQLTSLSYIDAGDWLLSN